MHLCETSTGKLGAIVSVDVVLHRKMLYTISNGIRICACVCVCVCLSVCLFELSILQKPLPGYVKVKEPRKPEEIRHCTHLGLIAGGTGIYMYTKYT